MKKKKIVGIIIAVVVLAAIVGAAVFLLNKGNGIKKAEKKEEVVEKNITVKVVIDDVEGEEYKAVTKGKYIKDALEEAEGLEIVFEETEDGDDIIVVNGVERKEKYEYWYCMKNDEYLDDTINKSEIADGDVIKVILERILGKLENE